MDSDGIRIRDREDRLQPRHGDPTCARRHDRRGGIRRADRLGQHPEKRRVGVGQKRLARATTCGPGDLGFVPEFERTPRMPGR